MPSRTITKILPQRLAFDLHRVVIYCRTSTHTQEQLNSMTNQVSKLTQLVAENPMWTLCDSTPSQALFLAFFAAENLYGLIDTNQLQPYRTDAVCSISGNRVLALGNSRIGARDFNLLLSEFASQDDISLRRFHYECEFVISSMQQAI